MNLKETAKEIREILDKRRKDIELTFIEEEHKYFMKDEDGEIKSNFPSVSKVFKTINYEGSNGWEVMDIYTPYDYGKRILSYNEGAYDSADPQNEGAAAVEHPIYHAGFNRKENKFFANIINNSFATPGEIVYGNSMSGIKGFFNTVTIQTDNSTELGKFKELYAVSSEYIESSY